MKDLKYQYEKLTEYVQYLINENHERKRNKANMIKEKKNYLEKQYNGKKVTIFAIIAIVVSLIAVSIIPTDIGIIIISVLIVLFIIFWLLYSSLQTKTFQSEDLLEQTYENVNAPFKRLLEKLLLQKILTTESEEKGISQIVNLIQWGYNAANILYNLKLLVEIHNKKLLGDSRKQDVEGIFSIQKEAPSIAKDFSNLRKDLIHPTVLRDFSKILLETFGY